MTTKRIGLLAGGLLAGALLLGTTGLAAAQDPTATPTRGPTGVAPGDMTGRQMGIDMMGGQMRTDMMGGQGTDMMGGRMGTSMMGGQMGTSMMGGQIGTSMMGGQMGTSMMTSEQLQQLSTLHDEMVKSGACDAAQMQERHAEHHPNG